MSANYRCIVLQTVGKTVDSSDDSPRDSTSSSDLDQMAKAKHAANQPDPYNVSEASYLKETEMAGKQREPEPLAKQV